MAKGYWVARVDVENEEAYAKYRSLNAVAFAKYGAKFIVRESLVEVIDLVAAYRARIVGMAYGTDAAANATGPQPALAPVAPLVAGRRDGGR